MTKMFIRARESMVRNTRGQTMTEYAPDRRLTVPQIGTGSSNSSRSASESSMLINTRDVYCFGTKARERGRILTAEVTPIKHRHSIEGRNRARPIA